MRGLITDTDLRQMIREEIKKIRPHNSILSEGVRYDSESNSFTFDFNHDSELDFIRLEQVGHHIEQFGRCYYYGYEFSDDIDSKIRSKFINLIKFPESFEDARDIQLFITKAVGYLDSQISLPKYNVVIYPQSLSELNRVMLSYLSRITTTKYIEIELIKELPHNIEFDYDRFTFEVLNSKVNNKPRYTEKQKQDVIEKIGQMMEDVHNSDYFSIARNIKKYKFRQYIKNYYKFKDKRSEELYKTITQTNVILLDDIVTSGTTIYHLLNTLRSLNDSNNIVVFSLIGKEF